MVATHGRGKSRQYASATRLRKLLFCKNYVLSAVVYDLRRAHVPDLPRNLFCNFRIWLAALRIGDRLGAGIGIGTTPATLYGEHMYAHYTTTWVVRHGLKDAGRDCPTRGLIGSVFVTCGF